MRIKKAFNLIISLILVFTSMPFCVNAQEIEVFESLPVNEYVPGEIVITTSGELVDVSEDTFSTASVDDCTPVDFEEKEIEVIDQVQSFGEETEESIYVLSVDGDIEAKCEELEKLPGVISAEPNAIFQTAGFTMPGEITSSSTSIYSRYMKWYFDQTQIPDAWQTFEVTGENVVIAVIDNGYYIQHGEFPTNLWTDENGNKGWNTNKDSGDISPIYKSDGTAFGNTGHGTNVASIIGALANGSNNIGAAYGAKLMLINAARYTSDSKNPDFSLDDLIEAIDFAVANGADIINMSLGSITTSSSLEAAVNRAYNAGVAVIGAAGNASTSTATGKAIPASYSNVIGVMATDSTDTTQLAKFSNYDPSGTYYDVAAPGTSIVGCSYMSGKLSTMNGTSQAAPLVASFAALYLSKYPDATVDELYDAIRNSPETQVTSNKELVTGATYYFKFLNAYELIAYGKIKPEIELNLSTTVTYDVSTGYLYGLNEGYTDISDYITVKSGTGTAEFVPSPLGNGTGAVLNIYDIYGDLYKTYRIIIFGDTNGDGYADGQDAVIDSCIINSPDSYESYIKYAADVDFDDDVDELDRQITADYAIGLDFVFQTR